MKPFNQISEFWKQTSSILLQNKVLVAHRFPGFKFASKQLNQPLFREPPKGLTLFLFTAILLSTLFAIFPQKAFPNRGIVAVPIKDILGETIGLYKSSHALVVGISDYTGGWPKLPGVKNDIIAVKETLEKIGFHVVLVENPNQSELESAFKDFVLEYGLDPENRLLFYYAGHGHTHKPDYATNDPEEWMGYLVSRNAPNPQSNIVDFFKNSLSMRTIENIALTIESKHALFIFDSCFSGTIFGLSRSIPQDIQERTAKPVRQFITSGTADQVVPDISIFRRQLISGLDGEADRNNDGYVTGSELGMFLEETVTNLSRRTQTPRYGKIQNRFLNKGDFVFNLSASLSSKGGAFQNKNLMDSIQRLTDEVFAKRGERTDRIQIHYSKLKELDKFKEDSISLKTKIKLWKDFITLYPNNNPFLENAKEVLEKFRQKDKELPATATVEQRIEKHYASLIDIDQKEMAVQEKISAWLGFISTFPKNNPRMSSALNKISELHEEQDKIKERKRLNEEAQRKEEARLAEEKRLAEESAHREEEKRLAEQKRLAEEAARIKEEARLAEEKRLAEETARREEEKRLAEQKRLAEEAARIKEEAVVARLETGKATASPESSVIDGMVLISGEDNLFSGVTEFEAYYIDIYEVTQRDFKKVMKKNPSKFKVPNRPVEKVTWEEAGEYCRRAGKRLPTSIEWEKAARAGAGSKYPWGNELGKNNANCNDCGSQWDGLETAPVGSFSANALGLYDMVGNVWEWVDKTHDNKFKVLRGGSWMDDSSFANPEGSYFILPDNRSSDIGFRCAITQRQSIAPMKTVSDNNSLQEETVQLAEATVLTPLETVSDSNSLQNKKEQLAEETLRSVNNVEIASLPPNEIETPTANWSGEDEMVLIPGGRFVSGEFFSRKFKVVKAFKMDTHEITQKEYERVMMKNPSRFRGERNPVEKISWYEAKEYCERLGKRLPKGDEWEKAARAGTSSNYPWGNNLGENKANCPDCGSEWDALKTAPVGSFPANAWGLYDMAGNVWEWVDETHNEKFKVLRGGSWMDDSSYINPAASYFVLPDNRSSDIGFRCAKDADSAK